MQIYNTATHRKEEFVPREEGKVAMYACGPTVYNYIHIGNARTFLTFDVVRRYLTYRGYEVTFVQNVTDVDDKIINRANEEGRTAAEVAADYTEKFIADMHRFGIKDPDVRPKATEEIDDMIALVERLIERGHAYEVDGDVYYSVRSFSHYGQLSGRNIDDLQAGARVDVDERKRDPLDFALWKSAKPGEPYWESPWGQGRPGWHLECSAMSEKYLGLPIDIHGGGSDLCFPHHENEKAQSEAAGDEQFVHYWLHGGMLNIFNEKTGEDEKMSKSLGNFLLLKDVLDQCDPNALRLLMLQTHYRSPLAFSAGRLAEADESYKRISTAKRNLEWAVANAGAAEATDTREIEEQAKAAREKFIEAMDDDFNTAGALGAVFTLVGAANSFLEQNQTLSDAGREAALGCAALLDVLLEDVLGISLEQAAEEWPAEVCQLASEVCGFSGDDTHAAVDALLDARAAARKEKNWAVADAVRDGLQGLGFVIEDTPNGARVTYGA